MKQLLFYSQTRTAAEVPALITEAALQLCKLAAETRRQDTGNPHVEKNRHYIRTHLTQDIHVEDIACAVGLSPYHLSRLFKLHTGMTMKDYLLRERIEAAKQLLSTSNRSISQIASLLCFCDQSYFTFVFRKQTGMTPSQFCAESKK